MAEQTLLEILTEDADLLHHQRREQRPDQLEQLSRCRWCPQDGNGGRDFGVVLLPQGDDVPQDREIADVGDAEALRVDDEPGTDQPPVPGGG
eukprot:CAMPEP_0115534326 /NCGR_PEP_ID=MMETSP0271-20121206/86613_1 /TAXON_ID=71861 /ORGANISM="Scrippsiella trochoidea, Strain CCMP3099" /LENGTH=91 /DNA_ID=CAMNT_0002966803 /DNA_START=157 /DNA_END=428 /DNA_ORIENTATION=-